MLSDLPEPSLSRWPPIANTQKLLHAYTHVTVLKETIPPAEVIFQACSVVSGDGQSLSPPISSKLNLPCFENCVSDPFTLLGTNRRAKILQLTDLAQKSCLIFALCYIVPLNQFPETGNYLLAGYIGYTCFSFFASTQRCCFS